MIRQINLPTVRGKYIEKANLSAYTWFRVGGPADVLFMPADKEDLAHFLKNTSKEIPVFTMGVGSNLSCARWRRSRRGHQAWLSIPQN